MRYGGLIAAIIFAAIAAVIVMRMSIGDPAPQPVAPQAVEQKTVNIYIAAKPITVGNIIKADDIASQPWPEHLALDGFVLADGKTNVAGMVARGPFQTSEPLITAKLANPNDPNFLAGDLPKGMRVISIPINETDGVAGFVFPGDFVDVIFTHDVEKWVDTPDSGGRTAAAGYTNQSQKVSDTIAETLLTNVKVLAIDQRPSNAGATNEKGGLVIPRSASLMVSPADAQRVRLAGKKGSLSLTLRSLADKESVDAPILTESKDISMEKESISATAGSSSVKIVRGAPQEGVSTTDITSPIPMISATPPQSAGKAVAP
jgi:pilus assembly protein CpaB